jgi:hypothetical protein
MVYCVPWHSSFLCSGFFGRKIFFVDGILANRKEELYIM